jgi:hypothetical protein
MPAQVSRSEEASAANMDSSDGGRTPNEPTVEKKQKKKGSPADKAYVEFLAKDLQELHMDMERKEQSTIDALSVAADRITTLTPVLYHLHSRSQW